MDIELLKDKTVTSEMAKKVSRSKAYAMIPAMGLAVASGNAA